MNVKKDIIEIKKDVMKEKEVIMNYVHQLIINHMDVMNVKKDII